MSLRTMPSWARTPYDELVTILTQDEKPRGVVFNAYLKAFNAAETRDEKINIRDMFSQEKFDVTLNPRLLKKVRELRSRMWDL